MTKVRTPKPDTLKKYGLTEREWLAILKRQGGACAVCRKVPENGRLKVPETPGFGVELNPECALDRPHTSRRSVAL